MKKIYFLIVLAIILFFIIGSLNFVQIPSPSKRISEEYKLEIQ